MTEFDFYDLLGLIGVQLSPTVLSVTAAVLLFLLVVTNAWEHGYAYSKGRAYRHWLWEDLGIHAVDIVQEWCMYLAVLLTGASLILLVGVHFLSRPVFQGLINLSSGRSFLDVDERDTYDLDVRGKTLWSIPKPLSGKDGRLLQVVAGGIIVIAWTLAEIIK